MWPAAPAAAWSSARSGRFPTARSAGKRVTSPAGGRWPRDGSASAVSAPELHGGERLLDGSLGELRGWYAGKGHMILAVVAAEASAETFTGLMDHVAQGFEALGAAILVVGVIWSFVLAAVALRRSDRLAKAYLVLRQAFGGTLLLGLEILVAADLVRTVAVAPTLDNVLVLGLIVVIRTFLSFSLETEIEGVAPWRRALISGAGTIRRASASALESETPP
jgi:uncharacterized membrane protein